MMPSLQDEISFFGGLLVRFFRKFQPQTALACAVDNRWRGIRRASGAPDATFE